MKKILLTLFAAFVVLFTVNAQEIKTVPTNQETARLADGWRKFELQGVVFDIEVLGGSYVQGNIVWFDGTTYSGGLRGAFISGRGTYTWSSGARYEGSFRNGERHGKGSYILKNGKKWSGKWKYNKKNGKGKVFDPDGTVVQEGVWKDDKLVVK